MNNNKIKIVSVIALLLFAGSLAIPSFTHLNCNMKDCNSFAEQCDKNMMDMAENNCSGAMTECTVMPFQPVASAPLNIVDLQKNLTVDYNVSFSENFNISEEYTLLVVVDKLCSSEVHPGFQTPLLV